MSQPTARCGLFLCRCGANIADFVDLPQLESWAKERGDLCFVETHDLLCSPAGKTFVEDTIRAHSPDTVVVAACSPKMHEKTFGDAAQNAGLNMARVAMANVREQCAWVTADKAQATRKAQSLIAAGIARAARQEDLEPRFMECLTDLVVIGGGIAGMEAALAGANAGRTVTIIEREISLGGSLIKTEEVAPAMECSPCLLAPRLAQIKEHPNIRVVTQAEVTDVIGFYGNFTVRARRKARYVKESCIGCEMCFEVCPASVTSAFHLGLGQHKAVYTAFPGSVPAAAAIDRSACLHFTDQSCDACVSVCPFGSIDFEDQDEDLEFKAGAVIVATGYDTVDPTGIGRLGFGVIDDVYDMPQFERIASSNGPYGGEIRLRDGRTPGSLAVIHCVGSLCADGLPYCSGICCTLAAKAGELFRKKIPGATVTSIHDRLVFDGPAANRFFRRQIEEGTKFLRVWDLCSVSVERTPQGLRVSANGMEPITVDMVVLATGMIAHPTNAALAGLCNTEVDAFGFLKPDHGVLHATGTTIDGIYAAGCVSSPCDSATAVSRAHAAVGHALSRLVPGRQIELEVLTCSIDAERCAGCKLCVAVCPYKAIAYDREKAVSVITEAICRGCGTCAATCPAGAASAKHFTDTQIYAELGGVLHG